MVNVIDKNEMFLNKKKLSIIFIILFFVAVSSFLTFSISVLLLHLILVIITLPILLNKNYKFLKLMAIIIFISLCYVLIIYIANQLYYGAPYYIGGSDDLNYEKWGYDVYNSNIYNPSKIIKLGILDQFHNSPFFAVYISILIRFANMFDGYSTFMPRIANVYFLVWVCIILEYLLRRYTKFNDEKIYFSIAIFALMPNIQYVNAHIFRDMFNLFQIFFIVYLADQALLSKFEIKNIFYIVVLFFMIYITYYTRKNSLAFAAALISLLIFDKSKYKKTYIIISFLVLIIFAGNILKLLNINNFIDTYSNYVVDLAGDGISSLIFKQKLLPFGIFFRSIYGLIIPFPNFFNLFSSTNKLLYDIVYFLIYSGVLIQILFIPFIIKRIFRFDFLSLAFLVCYLGVIITTFTFRHVILYYPFMVALGVDGYMSSIKKKKTLYLFFSALIGSSLGLIYMFLKIFT